MRSPKSGEWLITDWAQGSLSGNDFIMLALSPSTMDFLLLDTRAALTSGVSDYL